MYQSVGHEIIDLFGEAMNLPLYRAEIRGDAQTTEKEYSKPIDGDEVEDLFQLLSQIKVNEPEKNELLFSLKIHFQLGQTFDRRCFCWSHFL